jgi:hypothetical protein
VIGKKGKDDMERDVYMKTQLEVIKIAKQINELPLERFLSAIQHAETVAPLIDPTMYRKAQDNLRAIKDLAKEMLPIKEKFGKLFQAVVETAMRGDMYGPPRALGSEDVPPKSS